jgi:hypothetical protein
MSSFTAKVRSSWTRQNISCDLSDDRFPLLHRHFFHTITLADLQRIQHVTLQQILAQIRSQGASPDDIAFAPVFNAAMVAQGFAAHVLRTIKVGRYYDPQWVAAQAWPRPLPDDLYTYELFQHAIDGFGGTEMVGRGYDMVATLHVPNSVALGLVHLRTGQNKEFKRFSDRFKIKCAKMKIDGGGEALHKGGLLETVATTAYAAGPPIVGSYKAMCFSEHECSEVDAMVAIFIGSRVQVALTADQRLVYECQAPGAAIDNAMAAAAVNRAHFSCTRRRLQEVPIEENAADLLFTGEAE